MDKKDEALQFNDSRGATTGIGDIVAYNWSGSVATGIVSGIKEKRKTSYRRSENRRYTVRILRLDRHGQSTETYSTVKNTEGILKIHCHPASCLSAKLLAIKEGEWHDSEEH